MVVRPSRVLLHVRGPLFSLPYAVRASMEIHEIPGLNACIGVSVRGILSRSVGRPIVQPCFVEQRSWKTSETRMTEDWSGACSALGDARRTWRSRESVDG